MARSYSAKFTDYTGQIFTVQEVIDTPVGLTVYYTAESTKEKYSCLLEAFGQRFREVQSNE